jgi:hypothetical protein
MKAGEMAAEYFQLAQQVADLFAVLPQVEAVALSGSRGSVASVPDSASDIDLYIYTRAAIPLAVRQSIIERSGGATRTNIDLNYWGAGDEWFNAPTGIEVDANYFDVRWMEEQISRVVDQKQAGMGYTTCFWYTVSQSIVFSDPKGWFAALQARCKTEYPESLRQNIITLNHPVLRDIIPAYAHQLDKAVLRQDLVSINHRLAALFASYFDIIFALNRQLHPGEKRLVELACARCAKLPENMAAEITAVLQAAGSDPAGLSVRVNRLLDHLDQLLEIEGFERKTKR